MTDVPQVVSIFNAVGGGAAALVAAGDFVRLAGAGISTRGMVATVLDIIIGPVTFSGSLIAAGKLQGWVSSRPVVFPGPAWSPPPSPSSAWARAATCWPDTTPSRC